MAMKTVLNKEDTCDSDKKAPGSMDQVTILYDYYLVWQI